MHMREMLKEESSDARDYALIARELHSMDPASQLTVKPLFELQLEESTWGRLGPGIQKQPGMSYLSSILL